MSKWLILSDGYHSSGDEFTSLTPPALGVPPHDFIKPLPDHYTNEEFSEAWAVIVEPIKLDVTDSRKAWLVKLREDCTKYGVVLIFDEIITGLRVPKYSVANWWGIKPDISTFGKACANGFSTSFVGGKKEIMDGSEYFISKTHSGNAINLAACKATLTELKQKNMENLFYYANKFQDKFNEVCQPIGVSIKGYGTRGSMDLTDPKVALFCQEACKAGLLFGKAFFFNFSHMEHEMENYCFDLICDIVVKITSGKCKLEGELPQTPFVR